MAGKPAARYLKIVRRLDNSGVVFEAFERVGCGLDDFTAAVARAMKATRRECFYDKARGRFVYSRPLVDWKTRTEACWQYMRAVQMERWPLETPESVLGELYRPGQRRTGLSRAERSGAFELLREAWRQGPAERAALLARLKQPPAKLRLPCG